MVEDTFHMSFFMTIVVVAIIDDFTLQYKHAINAPSKQAETSLPRHKNKCGPTYSRLFS